MGDDQGITRAGAATIGLNKTGAASFRRHCHCHCHCYCRLSPDSDRVTTPKSAKKDIGARVPRVTLSERATQLVRCGHWICSRSYFAPCPVCSGPSKYEALEAVGHRLPQFWRVVDQRTQAQNHGGYVRQRPKNRPPAAPHGIEQASLSHLTLPLLPTEQDT